MLVELILKRFIRDAGPEILRQRLMMAVPGVVRGMEKKGMSADATPEKVLVRDALFRLWKSIVGSGDIADMIRDVLDDAVVARVGQVPNLSTLTSLVEATVEATVAETF